MKQIMTLLFVATLLMSAGLQNSYAKAAQQDPLQTPDPISTLPPIQSIYLPIVQSNHALLASEASSELLPLVTPEPIPTLAPILTIYLPVVQRDTPQGIK